MRLISALLLLATTAAAIGQAPTSSATHLVMSIEDGTGGYIPAASIDIDKPSESLHITAKSDSAGHFAVDLKPGSYDLSITAPGFKAYREPLDVTSPHQKLRIVLIIPEMGSGSPNVPDPTPIATIGQNLNTYLQSPNAKPIEIKVVVINMFEVGADTGDAPGEYQYWVEREHFDTVLPFPAGYHDLRLNPNTGVLGVLTGVGTSRATATIMALGLDPRFDLTHAYFLVAGIGGIDPQIGSLGSAVWSDYIVDGDLAHEIDAREIPKDWKTGYVPLGKSTPYEQPRAARFGDDGNVYHLNTALVDWAFNLTKDTELPDTPQMKERRMQYAEAAAHRAPFVLLGDNLSAATFWHGKLLNQWARDWSSTKPTATAPTPSAVWRTPAPSSPSPGSPGRTSSTSTASSSSALRRTSTSSASASPPPKASRRPRSATTAPTCPHSNLPTASVTSSSTTSSQTGRKLAITSP